MVATGIARLDAIRIHEFFLSSNAFVAHRPLGASFLIQVNTIAYAAALRAICVHVGWIRRAFANGRPIRTGFMLIAAIFRRASPISANVHFRSVSDLQLWWEKAQEQEDYRKEVRDFRFD